MEVYVDGRPYRRSLRTCLLELAEERATEKMVDILARQKAGQKVFATSLKEMRDAFLTNEQSKVTRGELSPLTLKNTTLRIDRGLAFLKEKNSSVAITASIDAVDGGVWQGYVDWRLKQNPELGLDTLDSELVTIRACFEWSRKAPRGWCTEKNIPHWELDRDSDPAVREKMSPVEYKRAMGLLSTWAADATKDKDRLKRQMVKTVIEVMEAGGLRTGEALSLRRKHLDIRTNEIEVQIEKANTKVRKARPVGLFHNGVVALKAWLMKRGQLKPDDLVFSTDPRSNTANRVFYKEFGKFREDVLIPAGLEKFDPYHARHFAITQWLNQGRSVHLVATLCGTSVLQIEKTYSGVIALIVAREFAKQKMIYKEDGSFEVIDAALAPVDPETAVQQRKQRHPAAAHSLKQAPPDHKK